MYSSTHGTLRTVLVVAGLLAFGGGQALAGTLSSGPLRVLVGASYSCAAVNVGSKDVSVEVKVTINNGGSGVTTTCATLNPESVCAAENDAGGTNYRFCTITTKSKRSIRGTFCNTTTGICIPVQ